MVNELLIEKLTEIMRDTPQRMEIVGVSGEMLSEEAMDLARFFDKADGLQQTALLAMVEAFKP